MAWFKRFILMATILLCLDVLSVYAESVVREVAYTSIASGKLLLRENDDRVYSAVIRNLDGWKKFKSQYPIDTELTAGDFNQYLFIVVFSDQYWEIVADGFKKEGNSSYYLVDIADMGTDIDIDSPPPGKKYSAWIIIRVSRDILPSHVGVRDRIPNGLSKRFE